MSTHEYPGEQTIGHESQQKLASDIYNKLQENLGRTVLFDFNDGAVFYPDTAEVITADQRDVSDMREDEKKLFRMRGFTDEDMMNGLTHIRIFDYRNPQYPGQYFQSRPLKRVAYLSNTTGNVVADIDPESPDSIFEPAALHPLE